MKDIKGLIQGAIFVILLVVLYQSVSPMTFLLALGSYLIVGLLLAYWVVSGAIRHNMNLVKMAKEANEQENLSSSESLAIIALYLGIFYTVTGWPFLLCDTFYELIHEKKGC